jgi:hypothetical protein
MDIGSESEAPAGPSASKPAFLTTAIRFLASGARCHLRGVQPRRRSTRQQTSHGRAALTTRDTSEGSATAWTPPLFSWFALSGLSAAKVPAWPIRWVNSRRARACSHAA